MDLWHIKIGLEPDGHAICSFQNDNLSAIQFSRKFGQYQFNNLFYEYWEIWNFLLPHFHRNFKKIYVKTLECQIWELSVRRIWLCQIKSQILVTALLKWFFVLDWYCIYFLEPCYSVVLLSLVALYAPFPKFVSGDTSLCGTAASFFSFRDLIYGQLRLKNDILLRLKVSHKCKLTKVRKHHTSPKAWTANPQYANYLDGLKAR